MSSSGAYEDVTDLLDDFTFSNGVLNETETYDVWRNRFSDLFGPKVAHTYAEKFRKHLIPHEQPEVLTELNFWELEIPIGHRSLITGLIERVRSVNQGTDDSLGMFAPSAPPPAPQTPLLNSLQNLQQRSTSVDSSVTPISAAGGGDLERKDSIASFVVDADVVANAIATEGYLLSNRWAENRLVPPPPDEPEDLRHTTLTTKCGFLWKDFEGEASCLEEFLKFARHSILRCQDKDGVSMSFLRGFLDNKPAPFFMKAHTKAGKSCSLLLIRLPSTQLLEDPIGMKESTMATMTNRFVFVYTPRSSKSGMLITYHKDPTVKLPWLQAIKQDWATMSLLSRERLFMHLVSEALMTNGFILENYRMQLESLIEVKISFAPKSVVEWMSLINRQAQVMKRCLVANQSAIESVTQSLTIDAQTTLHIAQDMAATAEEIEGNAIDAMNLRMGLVGFRGQENMKFFTYVSAVTAPLAVLTGWYGMNFDNMPELHYDESYYVLVGVACATVGLVIALIRYFHQENHHSESDIALNSVVRTTLSEIMENSQNLMFRVDTSESITEMKEIKKEGGGGGIGFSIPSIFQRRVSTATGGSSNNSNSERVKNRLQAAKKGTRKQGGGAAPTSSKSFLNQKSGAGGGGEFAPPQQQRRSM
eukprot:PhF_6_TR6987/c0_g1_i1/m.10351